MTTESRSTSYADTQNEQADYLETLFEARYGINKILGADLREGDEKGLQERSDNLTKYTDLLYEALELSDLEDIQDIKQEIKDIQGTLEMQANWYAYTKLEQGSFADQIERNMKTEKIGECVDEINHLIEMETTDLQNSNGNQEKFVENVAEILAQADRAANFKCSYQGSELIKSDEDLANYVTELLTKDDDQATQTCERVVLEYARHMVYETYDRIQFIADYGDQAAAQHLQAVMEDTVLMKAHEYVADYRNLIHGGEDENNIRYAGSLVMVPIIGKLVNDIAHYTPTADPDYFK